MEESQSLTSSIPIRRSIPSSIPSRARSVLSTIRIRFQAKTRGICQVTENKFTSSEEIRESRLAADNARSHPLFESQIAPWRLFLLLFIFLSAIYFFRLGQRDLWSAHEARAAQNAQDILDHQHWKITQLFDHQYELQKPIGYYALVALIAKATDNQINEITVRLPALLSALIVLAVIFLWCALENQIYPGLLAVIILGSSIHWISSARVARIDMPLTATTTLALFFYYRFSLAPHRWLIYIPTISLCFAAGLILKGLLGVGLPLGVMIVHWCYGYFWKLTRIYGSCVSTTHESESDLYSRSGINCYSWRIPFAIFLSSMLGILLVLPWYLEANRQTRGEFFRIFFGYHHFARFLGNGDNLASHPWWYYGPRIMIDFSPWSLIVPVLLLSQNRLWRRCRKVLRFLRIHKLSFYKYLPTPTFLSFVSIWVFTMFLLLSSSHFKRADYLLPLYPGLAIALAISVQKVYMVTIETTQKYRLVILKPSYLFPGILVLVCLIYLAYDQLILPKTSAPRMQKLFARAIRQQQRAPAKIILFRLESHLLAWHLKPDLQTVVEWHDINALLAEPGQHYFITQSAFIKECQQYIHSRKIEVVFSNEDCQNRISLDEPSGKHSRSSPTIKPQVSLVLLRTCSD